jgi:predicted naringenin-chalcone synthase
MLCSIHNFHQIRPRHEIPQEVILEWIAKVHAHAEASHVGSFSEELYQDVKERLFRLGFGANKIQNRGIHINDLYTEKFEEMELFPITDLPTGRGFKARSNFFEREMDPIFEAFYPETTPLPAHLIHVTCTGYVAPSPAQKLIARRDAGQMTTVTNAYHMGCYAAFPAIRMGAGYLHLPSSFQERVDVVHTEVGSIHMHPLKHSTEQLMVQSLFADGFIKYSLSPSTDMPHFKVHALQEEMIPNSSSFMTWRCEDHGLTMTISKEVPVLISRALGPYLERLYAKVGTRKKRKTYFAVHPGGPKILDYVEKILNLEPYQMKDSHEVLRRCGNMSSATIPHIWQRLLEDPTVENGSDVVCLAFGPGLSISGALLEKGGDACST